MRVFALETSNGYDLYEYVWKDPFAAGLGFPSEKMLIGNELTKRGAQVKLICCLGEIIQKREEKRKPRKARSKS